MNGVPAYLDGASARPCLRVRKEVLSMELGVRPCQRHMRLELAKLARLRSIVIRNTLSFYGPNKKSRYPKESNINARSGFQHFVAVVFRKLE